MGNRPGHLSRAQCLDIAAAVLAMRQDGNPGRSSTTGSTSALDAFGATSGCWKRKPDRLPIAHARRRGWGEADLRWRTTEGE